MTNSHEDSNAREYYCSKCGLILSGEEVIWADENGELTIHGKAYCAVCLPCPDDDDNREITFERE